MVKVDNQQAKVDNMYWVHPDSVYTHHSYCQEGDGLSDNYCAVMFTHKDDGVAEKAWRNHLKGCEVCSFGRKDH